MDYVKQLRINVVASDNPNLVQQQVTSAQDVYDLFHHLRDDAKHKVLGLALNESMFPRTFEVIGMGGVGILQSLKAIDIFKIAALHNTPYFILLMNHPSQTQLAKPTDEEREKIKEIELQAKVLGIQLVDFVIIGRDTFWSLYKRRY